MSLLLKVVRPVCMSMFVNKVTGDKITGADHGFRALRPKIQERNSRNRGLLPMSHFNCYE